MHSLQPSPRCLHKQFTARPKLYLLNLESRSCFSWLHSNDFVITLVILRCQWRRHLDFLLNRFWTDSLHFLHVLFIKQNVALCAVVKSALTLRYQVLTELCYEMLESVHSCGLCTCTWRSPMLSNDTFRSTIVPHIESQVFSEDYRRKICTILYQLFSTVTFHCFYKKNNNNVVANEYQQQQQR